MSSAIRRLGYCQPVPVSQRFIDLLNAPLSTLKTLAARHDLEGLTGSRARKWELAQRLALIPRDELEGEQDYLYAGSTSLSWLRFVPEDQEVDAESLDDFYAMQGVELDREQVMEALRGLSEGDPFNENDRPGNITTVPKLVVAREREDGDYILTFAISKRIGHVIHNFESQAVYEDEFFNALLRPAQGIIEVRASASRAQRLARTWLADFSGSLGCKTLPVAITHGDWQALHDDLNARLDVYRGKTTTGTTIFDTHEYTKADIVDDLYGENEFNQETANLEPISMDLLFDVNGFGEVRIHVSVINGSIFIRTAVPEHVIEYVRSVLEQIKAGRAGGP